MAAGAGWAWLRDGTRVVHVSGARGPRGPLTATVDRVPVLEAGQTVALDLTSAAPWLTPRPPEPASAEAIAAACTSVRAHAWNDPRAFRLGIDPLAAVVADLAGRGPGLTPAGDDALCGFMLARRAVDPATARHIAAVILAGSRRAGEPSRSLLRAAAHGEAFSPAAAMLGALLRADGPSIAPALRTLTALGGTTGRALLTGLLCGLTTPHGDAEG